MEPSPLGGYAVTMKETIISWAVCMAIGLVTIFAVFAFAEWSANPATWSPVVRRVCAAVAFTHVVLMTLMAVRSENAE